jgi:hypothetical protein
MTKQIISVTIAVASILAISFNNTTKAFAKSDDDGFVSLSDYTRIGTPDSKSLKGVGYKKCKTKQRFYNHPYFGSYTSIAVNCSGGVDKNGKELQIISEDRYGEKAACDALFVHKYVEENRLKEYYDYGFKNQDYESITTKVARDNGLYSPGSNGGRSSEDIGCYAKNTIINTFTKKMSLAKKPTQKKNIALRNKQTIKKTAII